MPTAWVEDSGVVRYKTRFGPFEYDSSKQLIARSPLWTDLNPRPLSKAQHIVMKALLQHPNNLDLNKPVTYEELNDKLDYALGVRDTLGYFTRVNVVVYHLRDKLSDTVRPGRSVHNKDAFRLVHNIREVGYLFSDTYPNTA